MADIDVEQVLSELTLLEKIQLLSGSDFWHTAAVPRLGVPSLRVLDGPNGIRGTKFVGAVPSACFPCGTGLAATFNKELLLAAGQLMGEEALHKNAHVVLGPTANMQRGPLGGRGFESFSEDPHLTGLAASKIIEGLQLKNVAATMKHYVCNDLEHERNALNSVVTQRALREIYLEPFRLAVKHSNPKAMMTLYNYVNGEHALQLHWLLEEVLRGEWGWEGLVMLDWFGNFSTRELLVGGMDLEMPGPLKLRLPEVLVHIIKSRELCEDIVDERVRNLLKLVKWCKKSNLQERGPELAANNTPETRAMLNRVALEAVVLLKNDDLLPLKKTEKIAVIGPNADMAAYCGGGSASLITYYAVTPLEGIAAALGREPPYTPGSFSHVSLPSLTSSKRSRNPVTGERGCNLCFYNNPVGAADRDKFDEMNLAQDQLFMFDYVHDAITDGVYYNTVLCEYLPEFSGDYEFSLTVTGTAKLYVDDKLVVDNSKDQVRGTAFLGAATVEVRGKLAVEAGRAYKVRVEYGSTATGDMPFEGALPVGGALHIGVGRVVDPKEEIQKAVDLAKLVDKVVLVVGMNQEWELEGFDRPNMDLPPYTNDLVEAVLAANPATVVVNQLGTPVEMPWASKARAIVHAWFGGSETGNAIANVLFGSTNPSGKLTLSWPRKLSDNPTYLNFKTVNGRVLYGEDIYIGYRFYEKMQREVEFPFGHGLSYTTFGFSDVKASVEDGRLKALVRVKNTGSVAGAEVAQFYVAQKNPTTDRPLKELKGFAKVELQPGEEKVVSMDEDLNDSISYYHEHIEKWVAEKGTYTVEVGSSSAAIACSAEFEVAKTTHWTGI